MSGTLPHTENSLAQTVVEQQLREQLDSEGARANDDPTTLKFDGKVAVSDDDRGSDPYNRTGRFKRLVR